MLARRTKILSLALAPCAFCLAASQANSQAQYSLKPTPKTVAWGYYDAKTPPVLRVKSGDTVEIQTLITNSPKRLEDAGVPPEQVEQSLRDITDQVKDKGPGGHILTGPVYIEGAEIGDVLEVKILAIKLAIPYAYNAFGPGRGYLPDDYPYAKMKIIPLDEKRMVAKFAPGIEIPLHPFFITMGLNDDLNACATLAVREMIDFLVTEKHLSRDDAYMLASVAADLHITELVDGNKGVHMMIPKSIFVLQTK